MADAGRPLQLSAEAKSALNQQSPEDAARFIASRQEWACKMRVMFSPRDMIFENGNLDPECVLVHLTEPLETFKWSMGVSRLIEP